MNMRNDDNRGNNGGSHGVPQDPYGTSNGQTPYNQPRGGQQDSGSAYSNGTYSQGWNQPRINEQEAQASAHGSEAPWHAQHTPPSNRLFGGTQPGATRGQEETSSFATQQGDYSQQGPANNQPGQPPVPGVTPLPPQPKEKRKIGLGAATAIAAVAAIAAGSITGVVVGKNQSSSGTSVVNEALNSKPAANSMGKEPEEGSVEAVSAKVLPAVVSVQTATRTSAAEGSGSIISPDGYVLTNHHVIAGAEQGGIMQVTLNDGSKHEADLVASDANTDVAIIKIKDVHDLPHLQFGDSDAVAVGQEVVAVGSPLGLNATVTSGIVSAKNRPVRASQQGGESSLIDAIQTDAAVNPGNSGGPLVDMEGNIVGMNSMIASLSDKTSGEGGSIGLGFAIPSNFAKRMADELINKGHVTHPTLGVKVLARDDGNGARIAEVEPGGPADQAGLKQGDIVTRVNDRLIENADALIAAARSQDFGATVTLEVSDGHSDDTRQVEVTLTGE